ncbi:ABC transporter permease [Moheibacter sediminis]|nr:ABC transporter permease [Moheibacter sediminis]
MINILGLTVGMVGIILVSLYWNDELNYNQWNPNREEIYSIGHQFDWSGKATYMSIASIPEGPTIKETFSEVEDFMACSWLSNAVVKTENRSLYLENYLPVTPNFFDFFPFEFIHGNAKGALSDLQSIVISEDWMNQLYDGKNPVGKKLNINQNEYIVKGVYRIPGISSVSPKAVTPIDWKQNMKDNGSNWGTYQIGIYIKVRKGTDIQSLENRIYNQIILKNAIEPFAKNQNISVKEYMDQYGNSKLALDQLSTIRLFGKASGSGGAEKGNATMLYLLTGLSSVIMILSAFNYINLTTASSIKRAKEVGIRKTLGASRSKLVLQFVFENVIICLFSLVLALALSEILLPYFNEYFEKELKIEGFKIYFDLLLILLLTTLISGIIPALYLSNFQPLNVLKGDFTRSSRGIWIRNMMLGLQFIVSLFFLIAGIVIYLQVSYMSKKDLGFKGDQVVAINFSKRSSNQKYNVIKQEFKKIPGVVDVSSGFQIPASANYIGGAAKDIKTGKTVDLALSGAMDFNFMEILDLKLVQGRNISEKYASDTISSILINETLAQRLGLTNPIGAEIEYGPAEKTFKIIGVVKDYFVQGFQTEIDPVVYFHWNTIPWAKNQMNYALIKINSENSEKTLAEIESKWKSEIETEGHPFKYHFIDQEFANTYKEYTRQQNLFAILTIIAISIALCGLFGLISLVVEQRMKEISIRKILGASQGNLIRLIGKEYLVIASISFLLCIPLTYYLLQKWLEEFAYRIEIPIWPFVVGLIVLFSLVLTIIKIRTMYAMRTNAVKYLKYE